MMKVIGCLSFSFHFIDISFSPPVLSIVINCTEKVERERVICWPTGVTARTQPRRTDMFKERDEQKKKIAEGERFGNWSGEGGKQQGGNSKTYCCCFISAWCLRPRIPFYYRIERNIFCFVSTPYIITMPLYWCPLSFALAARYMPTCHHANVMQKHTATTEHEWNRRTTTIVLHLDQSGQCNQIDCATLKADNNLSKCPILQVEMREKRQIIKLNGVRIVAYSYFLTFAFFFAYIFQLFILSYHSLRYMRMTHERHEKKGVQLKTNIRAYRDSRY